MTLVSELALWAAGPDADTPPMELEQLVREHFRFIWRLLRRLGLPQSDADDAAQQVFIIAHTKLHQIAPGRERAFLYGCALRRAAKWRDARARQARSSSLDEPGGRDLVSPVRSPEDLLDRAEARSVLDAVLDQMEEPLRTVFVLYEIEQLNSAEIAQLLDVPRGTVASRLRRAREEFEQRVKRLAGQRPPRRGGP